MTKFWILILVLLIGIRIYFVPKQKFFGWSDVELIEINTRIGQYPIKYRKVAYLLEDKIKYLYRAKKIFFNYLAF